MNMSVERKFSSIRLMTDIIQLDFSFINTQCYLNEQCWLTRLSEKCQFGLLWSWSQTFLPQYELAKQVGTLKIRRKAQFNSTATETICGCAISGTICGCAFMVSQVDNSVLNHVVYQSFERCWQARPTSAPCSWLALPEEIMESL